MPGFVLCFEPVPASHGRTLGFGDEPGAPGASWGTTMSRFVRLEINEMARVLERGYPRTQTIISCVLPKMIDMRTRVRMRSLEKDRVFV